MKRNFLKWCLFIENAHTVRLSDGSVHGGIDSSRKISSDERRAAGSLNESQNAHQQHNPLGLRCMDNEPSYLG